MTDDALHGLMDAMGELQPLYEVAEGQRAELERRGWSPTTAEQVALELLLGMIRMTFKVTT